MELGEEAVSGPDAQDDAGKADPVTLDDVITASLDGVEGKGDEPSAGKKNLKSDGDESGGEDAPAGDDDSDGEAAEGEGKIPDLDAPQHWPEDRKRAFAALPREGKEAMLRLSKDLEGGFTRKSQELGDKAKFADSVRGLFADNERELMQRSGLDEVAALKHLVELNRFASKDPVGYLKWTMQQLKVSPDQLVSQEKQPGQNGEDLESLLEDPKVKQLEAELTQLKTFIESQQQQQLLSVTNSIKSTIDKFRTELDDTGQLKYPHFDAVQRHMGALMDTDPELSQLPDGPEKLAKAYEMAVWARPDLRQSLVEQEAARRAQEAEKKRQAERTKRAVAAKPASGAPTVRPKGNSLDDAIEASLSKAGL